MVIITEKLEEILRDIGTQEQKLNASEPDAIYNTLVIAFDDERYSDCSDLVSKLLKFDNYEPEKLMHARYLCGVSDFNLKKYLDAKRNFEATIAAQDEEISRGSRNYLEEISKYEQDVETLTRSNESLKNQNDTLTKTVAERDKTIIKYKIGSLGLTILSSILSLYVLVSQIKSCLSEEEDICDQVQTTQANSLDESPRQSNFHFNPRVFEYGGGNISNFLNTSRRQNATTEVIGTTDSEDVVEVETETDNILGRTLAANVYWQSLRNASHFRQNNETAAQSVNISGTNLRTVRNGGLLTLEQIAEDYVLFSGITFSWNEDDAPLNGTCYTIIDGKVYGRINTDVSQESILVDEEVDQILSGFFYSLLPPSSVSVSRMQNLNPFTPYVVNENTLYDGENQVPEVTINGLNNGDVLYLVGQRLYKRVWHSDELGETNTSFDIVTNDGSILRELEGARLIVTQSQYGSDNQVCFYDRHFYIRNNQGNNDQGNNND